MTDTVDDLPPLREVISNHGLSAQKKFGQNFLFDLNLTRKIARCAAPLNEGCVIEVGPGPGGLTRALLLEGTQNLYAIEKDDRTRDILSEINKASGGRLHVIEGDALEVDIPSLGEAPRRIVANLPYNVATPLLISWLKNAHAFKQMTLMFQKEVAERIVATENDKNYSRLAVLANWCCDTRLEFILPARAFTPPPKVESAVVSLRSLAEPRYPCTIDTLETVTAAAFNQRRKMLRRSLKLLNIDVEALLTEAGIDPTIRAENVSLEEFCTLARIYEEMKKA
ncbi:16S rRNA (adenine(1518)-N(6)/adenine(1519)-N(6))-dimethyltransferase RsmA [Curvivirga sp.]|uniref:16S rRNA (adenine(1518)-N(6)/adenine(1519)-N(6))- dimethyltransferase RsmA n=1 Tax=Curvivirga sp. TaxID=2856848 RepID=UPI003B5996A2